jgi:hypothetical protein
VVLTQATVTDKPINNSTTIATSFIADTKKMLCAPKVDTKCLSKINERKIHRERFGWADKIGGKLYYRINPTVANWFAKY